MSTIFELSGFILLVIGNLTGTVGNGFIAIVNCIDWIRSRKLSPADMILSCLGLFRLALHVFVIQNTSFSLFQKDAFLQLQISIPSFSAWTFINIADLWFAAWLSLLYCIKIANFSHPLFLQMKQTFPGLVPWLLLGTVAFSAITTIVAITSSSNMPNCDIFAAVLSNGSDSGIKTSHSCKYLILFYLLPNFIPFVIFFSSSIFLLTSLWRHKNLLRNTARDVSTEAHLNAIKALAFFCILYVSHFGIEILDTFMFWRDIKCDWIYVIAFNVIVAYSSGHTFILIFMNPKLKQKSVRLLHRLKC